MSHAIGKYNQVCILTDKAEGDNDNFLISNEDKLAYTYAVDIL